MSSEIIIIGAGPYGLSVAAHLKAHNVDFSIFGQPMHTWRTEMPAGMHLKSEGFASSLSDPGHAFTLAHYCTARGIPYQDTGLPVSLETFREYGLAFQRRFAPDLDERNVVRLERRGQGFLLRLQDGAEVTTKRVVVATGLSHFASLPPALEPLPEPFVTHSSRHAGFDGFDGQQVIVLGGGASAVDCATLLRKAGAEVSLVTRADEIRFHAPPQPRSLMDGIRAPMSGLGPGWKSRLCTDLPLVFHAMPQQFRHNVVRKHLGPAACWWTKDEVAGKIPMHVGMTLAGAELDGERVTLEFARKAGDAVKLSADRVIAATGFRVDLRRLPFLAQSLLCQVRMAEQTPVLSRNFETSVPGLYFIGVSSANSFGPMMRFAYGTDYTARRLAAHLQPLARAAAAATEAGRQQPALSGSDA